MEVKIISKKENPLLKRKEIQFEVHHGEAGSTPARLEVRKAVADSLKISVDMVFLKRFQTMTGTRTAIGIANVYDSADDAVLTEPDYIVKRNVPPPPEKPKEQ